MGTIGTVNAVFEADTRTFTGNVEGVKAALGDVAEKSEQTSKKVDAAMRAQEAATRRALVANQELARIRPNLGEQEITAASARVTAAVNLQREAQQQYLRVQKLVRDGNVEESQSIRLVTAARLQAESAAHEVTAAKIAEAKEVRAAAEEEALSQNVIIRAFQRAAAVATESLAEIRTQLVETAEAAGLEAGGISSAFAGLSKLLGAGIAVGFAAHFLDEVAKSQVELSHLSEKTGISVTQLAGLQQIVRELGGEFEPISNGLVKMQKAQVAAIEGSSKAQRAFADIGISVKELETLSPGQLFERVGASIAQVNEPAVAAAAAIAIFGKAGAATIPVFKAQGDQLGANMKTIGEMTGTTEKSAEAARRWTADTARLSAEFKSVLIPVMEHAEDVVKGVGGTFMAAFTAVDAVLETAAAAVLSIVSALGTAGVVLKDLKVGDFAAAASDASAGKDRFVGIYKSAFGDIRREYEKTVELFTKKSALPPLADLKPDTDLSGLAGPPKGLGKAQRDADRAQLEAFLQGAEELKAAGNFSVFQENAYWHDKLASLEKGSANYLRVLEKSNEAEKRLGEVLRASLKPRKTGEDDAFQKDQIRFADEQARRIDALREKAETAQRQLVERGQLADIGLAVSQGELSKYQGLVAEAQVRAAAFATELSLVDRRLAEARALSSLPGAQEEILRLQEERAKLQEEADQQAVKDRTAIESATVGGALAESLRKFQQQADDIAGLVRQTFEETAQGINQSLSHALTDPARTGYERAQNLKNALSGTFRGIADQGINFGLGKLESGILGKLGIDGKGKPTGAKGNPLHVIVENAAAGVSGGGKGFFDNLPSLLGGKGSDSSSGGGGLASLLGSVASFALPGFASGGPIPPDMGSFIVGEHGKEILNIGSRAGHVTPNSALRSAGGGGDTHVNNFNVDARGTPDPAATGAHLERVMQRYAPMIVQASLKAAREERLRSPSTAR